MVDLTRVMYEWPSFSQDYTLEDDRWKIRKLYALDNGKHSIVPARTLGDLEELPLELQQPVLAQLDVKTLTDFRRVNKRAMQVVDSLYQYRAIIRHGPVIIRGI